MQGKLAMPLARPIVLRADPPRTLDTFLSALEFLNAGALPNTVEVDTIIDRIMSAAASQDPAIIASTTDELERMLQDLGQA